MGWHKKSKPRAPFRIVTGGSLNHSVERYIRTRGNYQDWEEVARCTSRELAQKIYARLMMAYVEEALK